MKIWTAAILRALERRTPEERRKLADELVKAKEQTAREVTNVSDVPHTYGDRHRPELTTQRDL